MQNIVRMIGPVMARFRAVDSWTALALLGILAVAFALRAWGVSFGLPDVFQADEGVEVYRALRLGAGEIDLDRVGKGGYYLVLAAEYGIYFVWSWLTGTVDSVDAFAAKFVVDPTPFWLIGRFTTAAIGTATVLVVWWQGWKMYGHVVGLISALLLAASLRHVIDSHFITVDIPVGFLSFWAVVLIAEDAEGRSRLNPFLFSVVAAGAVATKLPAAMLFLPFFVGRLFMRSAGDKLLAKRTIVPVLGAACLYVVVEPGVLLNFTHTFQNQFGFLIGTNYEVPNNEGADPQNYWAFYGSAIISSQGLLQIFVGVIGAISGMADRRRGVIIHLLFVVPFFIAVVTFSTTELHYARYVVPILPGLSLLAGIGLWSIARVVFTSMAKRKVLCASMALGLALGPATAGVEYGRSLLRPDSRALATAWIEKNVASGSFVLLEGSAENPTGLSVPLNNSSDNLAVLIDELQDIDQDKARYWELRAQMSDGPTYELIAVPQRMNWGALASYESSGVEVIVLRTAFFRPEGKRGSAATTETIDTRISFYRELQMSPRSRVEATFSSEGRRGHDIEIWRIIRD